MLRHRFMIGGDIINVTQMVLLHSGEYRTQNTPSWKKGSVLNMLWTIFNGKRILEWDLIQKNVPPGPFVMT